MPLTLQKFSFLLEFFLNGGLLVLLLLKYYGKFPQIIGHPVMDKIIHSSTFVIPGVILFSIIVNFLEIKRVSEFLRRYVFSLFVFIPLLIVWGDLDFCRWLGLAHLLMTVLALYEDSEEPSSDFVHNLERLERSKNIFQGIRLTPAQMVLLSFSAVILIGTFLLMLPPAAQEGKTIDFFDALFLSTSATCVTGLSTKSLAQDLTLFGQIVVLLLIQIGGLSIMTLYSSMAILLGKSMRMKERIVMQDLLDVSSLEDLVVMIVDIIKYTFFIELWGGIVLTIGFTFEGFEFGQAIYYGFFHSVSAFCNAGFALFDNSLESYATSPLIHGTVMILITLGGLGFIVLKELREVFTKGKALVRLGLHSKLVLVTSFILTLSGFLMFFFGEFLNSLDSYTLWEKIQISLFQSVTLRTAGFNTIPLTGLHSYTIYAMSLFMFIGGSPGSTAGGIKTTTLAILYYSTLATLKGDKEVNSFDRSISSPLVVRATALTFISIMFTSFFLLILMNLEKEQTFLPLFFEVISASGTVGLTLGVTPFLTSMGKLAVAALMLIGRIGPLTLILAIGQKERKKGKFAYPDGRIMIG